MKDWIIWAIVIVVATVVALGISLFIELVRELFARRNLRQSSGEQ